MSLHYPLCHVIFGAYIIFLCRTEHLTTCVSSFNTSFTTYERSFLPTTIARSKDIATLWNLQNVGRQNAFLDGALFAVSLNLRRAALGFYDSVKY